MAGPQEQMHKLANYRLKSLLSGDSACIGIKITGSGLVFETETANVNCPLHGMRVGQTPCVFMHTHLTQDEVVESPDIHFEPLVKLPPMELRNLEEDELERFKM